MAFTITNILATAECFIADIESDADADVGPLDVPHGLASVPLDVCLAPLLVEYYTSAWVISGVDALNIELTAAAAVGSGAAGDQIRVVALLDPRRAR